MDLEKLRARRAAYQRKWRAENRDRWEAIVKRGRKKWRQDHMAQDRECQRVHKERVRKEVLVLLGGVCARCSFDDWRALQIDHVNGGGQADSRTKQSIHFFRKWLLNHPTEAKALYQVLCANCNWIKRHENDEFGYMRKGFYCTAEAA